MELTLHSDEMENSRTRFWQAVDDNDLHTAERIIAIESGGSVVSSGVSGSPGVPVSYRKFYSHEVVQGERPPTVSSPCCLSRG
jgi:hypothetical protein